MTTKTKKNPTFVDLTNHPKLQLFEVEPCLPEHCYQKKDGVLVKDSEGKYIEDLAEQEIRIATIGNVDAGKSTTIGVIKSQEPDDGNGKSRKGVFRHQHEIDTGRTSDVGSQYLKYNNNLYSFSDLAGHEGYLRTTIYGLVSVPIDWNMLVVSANQGIEKMTREHLAITYSLNLSMFVVFTKVDMAPENVFNTNMDTLKKFVKKIKRVPVLISNAQDLNKYYNNITAIDEDGNKIKGVMDIALSKKFVPIFTVSNVSMLNMDLLQTFIFNIRPHVDWTREQQNENNVFVIDKTYMPKGVGLVISGIVKHGSFKTGQSYMLGPFGSLEKAVFYPVTIRNIRDNTETDIPEVKAGFSACFNVTAKDKDMVTRATIRKGMILSEQPASTKKFKANIKILHHPTKISVGYEPHLHCGGVKETMKIVDMDEEYIQAGKSTNAVLEFKTRRSYVEEGDKFIFREGNTRGSGTVLGLLE